MNDRINSAKQVRPDGAIANEFGQLVLIFVFVVFVIVLLAQPNQVARLLPRAFAVLGTPRIFKLVARRRSTPKAAPGKSHSGDRTGWLGWEDSNSRIQRSRLSSMA